MLFRSNLGRSFADAGEDGVVSARIYLHDLRALIDPDAVSRQPADSPAQRGNNGRCVHVANQLSSANSVTDIA